MRYHFFLHYGWFFQNLEKDFIPILLHTTVSGSNGINNKHSPKLLRIAKFAKYIKKWGTVDIAICIRDPLGKPVNMYVSNWEFLSQE